MVPWENLSWPFVEFLRRGSPYYILRFQSSFLKGNINFLQTLYLFCQFGTLSENFLAFFRKTSGTFFKIAYCVSIRTFQWQKFFSTEPIFFSTFFLYSISSSIHLFCTLRKNSHHPGCAVKTAFYLSICALLGKTFFLNHFLCIIFRRWAKSIRPFVRFFPVA